MTQSEIDECLRYELAAYGSGHQYRWTVIRDGNQIAGDLPTDRRPSLKKGDYVQVVAYSATGEQYKGRQSFYIRPLSLRESKLAEGVKMLRKEGYDPQQDKLYLFESTLFEMLGADSVEVYSPELAQIVVDEACHWAGVKPPSCQINNQVQYACFQQRTTSKAEGSGFIQCRPGVPVKSWLHESAHAILYMLNMQHDHTPEFAKLALDLYWNFDESFDMPPIGAKPLAKKIGLDIAWDFSAKANGRYAQTDSSNYNYAL